MQLDPVVLDALNKQVTHERQNSAVYLAIANQFDVLNLIGMAKLARNESGEETAHAQRITDYIVDRYGAPVVDALTAINLIPGLTMMSAPRLLFSGVLQREQVTTEQIKTIYDLAEDADDPQTCQFLLWFLQEQTESERKYSEIVAWCQFAEGNAAAIIALDEKLGG